MSTTLADLRAKNLREQGKPTTPPAQPPPDTEPEPETDSTISTNNLRTSAQVHNETGAQSNVRTNPDVHKTKSAQVHNETSAQVAGESGDETGLGEDDELLAEILALSKSPLVHNSSRAPEDLVGEIKAHIGNNWKKRIDKQTLMTRALMLLVHEIKTGKPLAVFGNESEVGLGE